MGNEVKYLDLQGLTLYDLKIKEYSDTKDTEIKIKLTSGKSDNGTILVTPGGTTPATYYTAEEAAAYNTENSLTEGDEGYKVEGDLKEAAVTTSTNIDVNIDGTTIIQDPSTKQLKVASSALVQYVGDKDGQNKYAIAVGAPDGNNEKIISLDINAESNAIEKTTTGLKSKIEIHKFADPSTFGTNIKEAYALTVNDTVITGTDNEQVLKIYKDSSFQDMKILHAVPAAMYTAEEAATYNAALTGAVAEGDSVPADFENNTGHSATGETLTDAEAIEYNATLEGAVEAGDEKTAAIKPTYNKLTGWVDIASNLRTEENLALCFAYENVDGSIIVEAVQVGSFLRESEFKDGLQVNGIGEVSVKYTTEKLRISDTPSGVTPGSAEDTGLVDALTVDLAHGIQLNNVQNAINYAAADSKTTITEVAADDPIPAGGAAKIVITKTVQGDGHSNYTISGQDLASAIALAAEVLRAQSAETSIDSVVGLTKAGNSETRTYTNTGSYIGKESTNTVKSDIKALDTQLKTVTDFVDSLTPITSQEIANLF